MFVDRVGRRMRRPFLIPLIVVLGLVTLFWLRVVRMLLLLLLVCRWLMVVCRRMRLKLPVRFFSGLVISILVSGRRRMDRVGRLRCRVSGLILCFVLLCRTMIIILVSRLVLIFRGVWWVWVRMVGRWKFLLRVPVMPRL